MNGYKVALDRFEQAVRELAWIGTQPPNAHSSIEHEYEEARAALIKKLQYRELAAEQRASEERK